MSKQHFQSLDGLRGVAILLVVFYHCFPHRGTGLLGYLCSAGWLGVDLFFVLSGFLITGILYDTQRLPHFYRNFYMRRVLRLFPLYMAFVGVVLLVARGQEGHSWSLTLAYLLYGSNIVRYFIPGFHSVGPVNTGHLWSLAVEEQFYLAWPWVIVVLRTSKRILLVCLFGSAGALLLRLLLARYSHAQLVFLYLELPTRADALLAGAAVAMLFREPGFMVRLKVRTVGIIGSAAALGFLALSLSIHTFSFADPPINTWGFSLSAMGAACVVLLALQEGSVSQRVLSARIPRFFGKYSYGIYLVHMAPLGLYQRYVLSPLSERIYPLWLAGMLFVALVLGVSTLVAMLSFHLLEAPFLALKGRFEQKPARRHEPGQYIPVDQTVTPSREVLVLPESAMGSRTVRSR